MVVVIVEGLGEGPAHELQLTGTGLRTSIDSAVRVKPLDASLQQCRGLLLLRGQRLNLGRLRLRLLLQLWLLLWCLCLWLEWLWGLQLVVVVEIKRKVLVLGGVVARRVGYVLLVVLVVVVVLEVVRLV